MYKARVLTLAEITAHKNLEDGCLWLECTKQDPVPVFFDIACGIKLIFLISPEFPNQRLAFDCDVYNKRWRIWNFKPSRPQREAATWDEVEA